MSHDRNDRGRPGHDPDPSDENQGEGDRISARRYNDHVREFVVYGDVGRAASDARDAVESSEAPELAAAEKAGKAPARLTRIERARALANRIRHAAAGLFRDLGDRLAPHEGRPDGRRP
jgi:hypothetical protein